MSKRWKKARKKHQFYRDAQRIMQEVEQGEADARQAQTAEPAQPQQSQSTLTVWDKISQKDKQQLEQLNQAHAKRIDYLQRKEQARVFREEVLLPMAEPESLSQRIWNSLPSLRRS